MLNCVHPMLNKKVAANMNHSKAFRSVREHADKLNITELKALLDKIQNTKINILTIGATGVGKSSTISALFKNYGLEVDIAIGESAKPQTMSVDPYELDNLVIWDTPGFGDSTEKDAIHKDKIIDILRKKDEDGFPLIDLIFLIIDGSHKDLGSAFDLFKNVVVPELGDDIHGRVLIGLNKADKVLHASFWDEETNSPKEKLDLELEKRRNDYIERIKEETGLELNPMYYCAGEIYEGEVLRHPYNLQKLLSHILDRLPAKKRISLAPNINENSENFKSNDNQENYEEKIGTSLWESLKEVAKDVGGKIIDKVVEYAPLLIGRFFERFLK